MILPPDGPANLGANLWKAAAYEDRLGQQMNEDSAMVVTLNLDLPADVEKHLRAETPDLGADVREAYAVELFRRGRLTHHELSRILGLDRFATDALLKTHKVTEDLPTAEEIEADRRTLERLLNAGR
jgi:predicted HTH domain antitoxin